MKCEPGVYFDLPEATYHRWQAVSASGLRNFARSPAHFHAGVLGALPKIKQSDIGRGFHCAVLEPHLYPLRFRVVDGNRRTNVVKAELAKMAKEGVTPLYPDQGVAIEAMRLSVYDHPAMGPIIESNPARELSIVWQDDETGLLCKTRLDLYAQDLGGGINVDLKGTRDASRDAFAKSIASYGYYRQAAFNIRGLQAVDLPVAHWMTCACEWEAPFAVGMYRLNDEAIAAGDEEVARLMRQVRACYDANSWPGYTTEIEAIDLPGWHYRNLEDAAWLAAQKGQG